MCGRYYVDRELPEDVLKIVMNPDNVHVDIAQCDIHPSEPAPVIIKRNDEVLLEGMRWGMTNGHDSQLIINARAESALDKPMFSESVLTRRCIVPARYFYEWDKSRNKCICQLKDRRTMFMAGIYKRCMTEERLVIITTAANKSMKPVHDRMPLIFPLEHAGSWISEDSKVFELLKFEPEPIEITRNYEQLSFDLIN